MDQLFTWIAHHRYPALFLLLMLGIMGLPVPDDILLLFAGSLIHKGALAPLPTVLAASLGSASASASASGSGVVSVAFLPADEAPGSALIRTNLRGPANGTYGGARICSWSDTFSPAFDMSPRW